ncbi:TlpA disulfide reductase family protein [Roseateles sp. DB2]|uniref:TlpA disulfide reductase family protein n=1 Tax=Roseateles sp. DB2 TaxID=3453717 RepID=UPI003EEE5DAA
MHDKPGRRPPPPRPLRPGLRRAGLAPYLEIGLAVVLAVGLTQAAQARPEPLGKGELPPAELGQQLDGTPVSLDRSSGKAYVISFWASWCGPCREELPVLINIQQIAGPQKMQVITVNIEERKAYRKLEAALKEAGLTPAYDPDKQVQKAYGVHGIPHMVIVGRDGRIVAVRVGYAKTTLDGLAEDLNRALAAPAEQPAQ